MTTRIRQLADRARWAWLSYRYNQPAEPKGLLWHWQQEGQNYK
jgi:hypothetical protein